MADALGNVGLSMSSDNKFISLIKQLKFMDGSKPKFTWAGTKEELAELISLVFENTAKNDQSTSTCFT